MNNITLSDLFGLMFVGLKLSGDIDWSWWLILMPIYIPIILKSIRIKVRG